MNSAFCGKPYTKRRSSRLLKLIILASLGFTLPVLVAACHQDLPNSPKPAVPSKPERFFNVKDSPPYSVDGIGIAARFGFPQGLAFDTKGNLYVADSKDHIIRMITPSRNVTIFAGAPGHPGHADGNGGVARFTIPLGIAIDRNDNLYVTDAANETIRKISPAGEVTTIAGVDGQPGDKDGTRNEAMFDYPHGVTVDQLGNVFVTSRDTIRKIAPDGEVRIFAGNPHAVAPNPDPYANGVGLLARFSGPSGLASDRDNNVYVADTGNATIRKIDTRGWVSTLAGSPSKTGIADGMGTDATFSRPIGVAIDSQGFIYVSGCRGPVIRRVSPAGQTSSLGPEGCANGIAVDSSGAVYVSVGGIGPGIHRLGSILKITPSGDVSTYAGPEPDVALPRGNAH